MDPKPQFDSLLGGNTEVPIEVDTMKFASARAQEIAAITQALDDPKQNLVFQRLPRHMRRRVMGHNAKRMPRNLRDAYTKQLKKSSGGPPIKCKTPSRKHRRRPANLLEEYNRRQRSHIWLETHIWHAKRFHMTERWGYKLPEYPNDRSYRACYRATANHCLLQDVSYLCCIELAGPIDSLLSGLSKHTNTSLGLTFGAEALLNGSREGNTMFYESDKYPWQPIGMVSFVWKPTKKTLNPNARNLWIWVHPAFYQRIVDALNITYGLNKVSACEPTSPMEDGKRKVDDIINTTEKKIKVKGGQPKKVEELKLATRNVPFERAPKFLSSCGRIQMVLLKDTLNRFRLTGPLSQAVLEEALQVVTGGNKNSTASSINGGGTPSVEKEPCLPDEIVSLMDSDSEGREAHLNFWLSIRGTVSPAQLPPRAVISLTVKDPRLQIPDKRTKAVPKLPETATMITNPPQQYASPLWSPNVRDEVTHSKLSTAELNALRAKLLVPGLLRTTEMHNGSKDIMMKSQLEHSVKARVPVILIQRPGSQDPSTKRLGFGCGWDIILPAGWAMPFWLAFIFRCARPSGLREAASHELESGLSQFLSPDTSAGVDEESRIGKELREVYFRLPPDKRPNFIKFGIACPFQCEWSNLIRDWMSPPRELGVFDDQFEMEVEVTTETSPAYFVLRDVTILKAINECLLTMSTILKKKSYEQSNENIFEMVVTKLPVFPNQEYSLLPVCVEALQKGVTDNMSVICIPSLQDISDICNSSSERNFKEPSHIDNKQDERHTLKKDHKKHLLRLRKQRVRAKRKQENDDASDVGKSVASNQKQSAMKISPTAELVSGYNKKMEELWLPNTNTLGSVKHSGSRESAGFVTRGNFSFTEGRGCGIGYISFLSLRPLMEVWLKHSPPSLLCPRNPNIVVLVRSPKSFQYRPAKLTLILK